jgi:hypothetical protein
MPLLTYPNHASQSFSHNEVSWTALVLSAHRLDGSLPSPSSTSQRDRMTGMVAAELPISSFRLEVLRAWNAACGERRHEFVGHA